jgi:hypothetical protein
VRRAPAIAALAVLWAAVASGQTIKVPPVRTIAQVGAIPPADAGD